jgi:predicted TIM-barrel fold metal-dependent hydrolase
VSFGAIDIVVNPLTPQIVAARPAWTREFHTRKIGRDAADVQSVTIEAMLAQMDAAGVERAFLVACKLGQQGLPGSWHMPEEWIAEAVAAHPDRFHGLAGIDPTEGMAGVRKLGRAVRDLGFIGAHTYPHWFELPPNDRKYYPFYAKCCELDIPIQMQVGQSLVYYDKRPLRSTGRPIALDDIACDFPELKIIGIHVGIPWHDEMIAMAWKHENVFIGSDAHSPKYWPASFVNYLNSYGRHKVLFGTDYPVLAFGRALQEIAALDLKPEVRQLFLRENALSVYQLAPPLAQRKETQGGEHANR